MLTVLLPLSTFFAYTPRCQNERFFLRVYSFPKKPAEIHLTLRECRVRHENTSEKYSRGDRPFGLSHSSYRFHADPEDQRDLGHWAQFLIAHPAHFCLLCGG